jgi:hypothetical protein
MSETYQPHKIKKYGYRPDLPDHRDYYYTVSVPTPTPSSVDLRANLPKIIYNQGDLGSCTANALACLYQYNQISQKSVTQFMPSRGFLFF